MRFNPNRYFTGGRFSVTEFTYSDGRKFYEIHDARAQEYVADFDYLVEAMDTCDRWNAHPELSPASFVNDWDMSHR